MKRLRLEDRNDVRIEVAENIRNAFDGSTAVHASPFVDVVRDDPHRKILLRCHGVLLGHTFARRTFRV